MVTPEDDAIEVVEEVVEEVKPFIAPKKEEKKSLYDAFWEQPDGAAPIALMLYNLSGYDATTGVRVGPFTAVAPNVRIACEMLKMGNNPIIYSVGEYFKEG